MKILMVHDSFTYISGAEKYILNISQALKNDGHEVYFFSFGENTKKTLFEFIYNDSSKKKSSRLVRNLRICYDLRKWIFSKNFDVIHLHHNYRHPIPILLSLMSCKASILQTFHDSRIICPTSWCVTSSGKICSGGFGRKCVINNCINYDHYIKIRLKTKISNFLLKTIVDKFISPSKKLKELIFQNGLVNIVFLPNFSPEEQEFMNVGTKHKHSILYIGAIEKHKGVEYLIKAFEKVKKDFSDAELHIVGDGTGKENLMKYLSDSKTDGYIILHGILLNDRKRKILVDSNLIVIPSIWFENSPLVIFESMSYGKPVIGSNIGGIPELIEDGINGFLFEPGNSEDLAQKIIYLLSNENLLKKFGENAKKIYYQKYSLKTHLKVLMEIYNSIDS